jgi:hypothetical protein
VSSDLGSFNDLYGRSGYELGSAERVPTGSPPTLVLSRRRVTPASRSVTTEGCEVAARSSKGSSTSRHSPACETLRSPEPCTIARGPKATTMGTIHVGSLPIHRSRYTAKYAAPRKKIADMEEKSTSER